MSPSSDWSLQHYRVAFLHYLTINEEDSAQKIQDAFLHSAAGQLELSKNEWLAWSNFVRMKFNSGTTLEVLRQAFENNQKSGCYAEYLARGYAHHEQQENAAQFFEKAASLTQSITKKISLLGEASLSYYHAGFETKCHEINDQLRKLNSGSIELERLILESQLQLAKAKDDIDCQIATMERILEIDPDNTEVRFSLAYTYSNSEKEGLALFHYLRIPISSRSSAAWNNLGVAFDQLDIRDLKR